MFIFNIIVQMFIFCKISKVFLFCKIAQMFLFSKIVQDFKLQMFPLEMLFESGNKSREKIQSFDIFAAIVTDILYP